VLPDDGDDDDRNPADVAESPHQWPRAIREPLDEFESMLAIVKRDIDPVINDFPMILPSKNAAIVLTRLLKELFVVTEKYKKQEKEGRQKVLEDFRKATMSASIAARLLAEDQLSIDRLTEIFQHLEQFQQKLDAVIRTYRRANPE